PEQIEASALLEEGSVETLGAIVLERLRLDLVPHELAQGVAKQGVLRRWIEQVEAAPGSARMLGCCHSHLLATIWRWTQRGVGARFDAVAHTHADRRVAAGDR